MATTYSWTIFSMKKKTEVASDGSNREGAIIEIHYAREGVDDDDATIRGISYGTLMQSAADVAAEDFIAFEDVTEADVIGWIENQNIGREEDGGQTNTDIHNASVDAEMQRIRDQRVSTEREVFSSEFPWIEPAVVPEEPEPEVLES